MDDPMAMKRPAGVDENAGMKRKAYEKELRKLQVELCHLQAWVKAKGARIIIVFEGRDAAGKGGTIKAVTERVSPRIRNAGERPSSTADLAAPRKETPNYPPQRQTLESHVRRQFPETETKSL
jgi:polyphosphate kinase 2 (PPK2 family)